MSNILKGIINEGAYQAGVSDGKQGQPNPRASSIYGPQSDEYQRGYNDGVKIGEKEKQERINTYKAELAQYDDVSTEELKQMLRDIRKRSDETQAIYDKYRGASRFSNDLPPNHKELKQQHEIDHKAWNTIHQVLFQRGIPSDQRLSEDDKEADYGDEFQSMVKRVGQMAKQGPRKTVWDPVKRVYKTVPVQQNKEENVAEVSPETTFNRLKGLKSWQVVIFNNYYAGKYSDYRGRYYYVLATSPEEAKQVVLDNADGILQDLLSMKAHNGKKILPRSKAVAITPGRIGKIEDGTVAGRMSTAGYKKMFSPQGLVMAKLSGGSVVDMQDAQGVSEANSFLKPGPQTTGKFPEPRERKPGEAWSKSETLGKDGRIYHWQDPRAKGQQELDEIFNPSSQLATILRAVASVAGDWLPVMIGGAGAALVPATAVLGPLVAGGFAGIGINGFMDIVRNKQDQLPGIIQQIVEKYFGSKQEEIEFSLIHAKAAFQGETEFRWRGKQWPVVLKKDDAEAIIEKGDKYWLEQYQRQQAQQPQSGMAEAKKANTKTARKEFGKRDKKPTLSDKEKDAKQSESDRLWDMLQQHIADADKKKEVKEQGVAEGWKEEAEDMGNWAEYVRTKLLKTPQQQRWSVAKQLSQIEVKNFGSELVQRQNYDPKTGQPVASEKLFTQIVQDTLKALNTKPVTGGIALDPEPSEIHKPDDRDGKDWVVSTRMGWLVVPNAGKAPSRIKRMLWKAFLAGPEIYPMALEIFEETGDFTEQDYKNCIVRAAEIRNGDSLEMQAYGDYNQKHPGVYNQNYLSVAETKKANTKTARKEFGNRVKAKLSDKEKETKQSEEDKLWAMLQQHMADKQKEVKESSQESFIQPGKWVKYGRWDRPEEQQIGRVMTVDPAGIVRILIDGGPESGKIDKVFLGNKSLSIKPAQEPDQGLNRVRTQGVAEEKVRLDPACWDNKKIGNPKTKVKGGVRVNNCVPKESAIMKGLK